MNNYIESLSLKLSRKYPSLSKILYPQLSSAFNCKTHLTTTEIITLFRLAKQKSVILEIGSYKGASACAFGAAINKSNGKVICIDTWQNDSMSEGPKNTFDDFLQNTIRYSDSIIPVKGWSHKVKDRILPLAPKIDLLFIDGDHEYEGVKCDWECYKDLLHQNSLVIFHDISWAEGVQKVVSEDVMPITKMHHSLPNMWWGYIL